MVIIFIALTIVAFSQYMAENIVVAFMISAFLSMVQYVIEKDNRYAIMFVTSAVLATILKIKGF